MSNKDLVNKLVTEGAIQSREIEEAFLAVDRKDFVREIELTNCYLDLPLPIGKGQTISQPTTVAIMLEMLEIKKGMKVLDIGAGSGWVSAIIANLVGKKGKVFCYELLKSVGNFGKDNLDKRKINNVVYQIKDAAKTWGDNVPYDRIISGAAFKKIPPDLIDTLAPTGIAVLPSVDNYLIKVRKTKTNKVEIDKKYGFIFVPFR